MVVASASPRARRAQRVVLDLLVAEATGSDAASRGELTYWSTWIAEKQKPAEAAAIQSGGSRPSGSAGNGSVQDTSHPAITVDLDACILCTRCVRACREEQGNDVIGLAWRGAASRICFDTGDPLGDAAGGWGGEAGQAGPTGALRNAGENGDIRPDSAVASVCPYCGVGCQLTWHVRDNRILRVEGRDGPANRGRLCVKGRYGFE